MPGKNTDDNDPIGYHPVGAGVGTAAGASAGATIGAVGGPVGVVAGATVGGIAGWFAGRALAEGVNPDEELSYWSDNHRDADYYDEEYSWDTDYEPAYRYGVYSYKDDIDFDDNEDNLRRDWESAKGPSRLKWEHAKDAVRDSWDRLSTRDRD
jgi:hypothetical protein